MTDTNAAVSKDTVTIQLPQAALKYLREITNSVNWADDLFKMRHGGDAYELMPEPDTEPVPKQFASSEELAEYRAAVKLWADKVTPAFELTKKQAKALKACVTFYSKKATLPPGRYSNALFDAFGVKGEEKDSED